jgi:hypothetical protein
LEHEVLKEHYRYNGVAWNFNNILEILVC